MVFVQNGSNPPEVPIPDRRILLSVDLPHRRPIVFDNNNRNFRYRWNMNVSTARPWLTWSIGMTSPMSFADCTRRETVHRTPTATIVVHHDGRTVIHRPTNGCQNK